MRRWALACGSASRVDSSTVSLSSAWTRASTPVSLRSSASPRRCPSSLPRCSHWRAPSLTVTPARCRMSCGERSRRGMHAPKPLSLPRMSSHRTSLTRSTCRLGRTTRVGKPSRVVCRRGSADCGECGPRRLVSASARRPTGPLSSRAPRSLRPPMAVWSSSCPTPETSLAWALPSMPRAVPMLTPPCRRTPDPSAATPPSCACSPGESPSPWALARRRSRPWRHHPCSSCGTTATNPSRSRMRRGGMRVRSWLCAPSSPVHRFSRAATPGRSRRSSGSPRRGLHPSHLAATCCALRLRA